MKTITPTVAQGLADDAGAGVEALADRAGAALQRARRATENTLDSLQSGVEAVRDGGPSALTRAAAQVDDVTRRGLQNARAMAGQARERIGEAGDRAREVVRDEPLKSMLAAAAAGAAAAVLIGWLVRGRTRADR